MALAHRLVSAYTSFVAVEEQLVTGSDEPVLVEVPVEMPAGVSYEGVFGGEQVASASKGYAQGKLRASILPTPAAPAPQLVEEMAERPSFQAGQAGPAGRSNAPITLNRSAPGEREPDSRTERDRVVLEDENRSASKDRVAPMGRGQTAIASSRTTYRVGEAIEILVTFQNLTGQTIEVPGVLSTSDGSARFQILDTGWNALPHPNANAVSAKSVRLQPGGRVTLRVVLNGRGGYQLTVPGTYHIVLLGSALGLPDSNTLTLHIEP